MEMAFKLKASSIFGMYKMNPDIVHKPPQDWKKRLPPLEMVLLKPPRYSKQSENCLSLLTTQLTHQNPIQLWAQWPQYKVESCVRLLP